MNGDIEKLFKFYKRNSKKIIMLSSIIFIIFISMTYINLQHQTTIINSKTDKGNIITSNKVLTNNSFKNLITTNRKSVIELFTKQFPRNSFSIEPFLNNSKLEGYLVLTNLNKTIFINYAKKYFKVKAASDKILILGRDEYILYLK